MENIVKYEDGKYRWTYDYRLFKRPAGLFRLYKIMTVLGVIAWFFFVWLSLQVNDKPMTPIGETSLFVGLLYLAGILAVSLIYVIFALLMRGRSSFLFEMDDGGIKRSRVSKKDLPALAEELKAPSPDKSRIKALTCCPRASRFGRVKKIKTRRRWSTLRLKSFMKKNYVFADGEDLDAVLAFIRERVPSKTKIR